MLSNNLVELGTYFVFIKRAIRNAKGDRHNLNSQNTNITISTISLFISRRVDIGKEVGIQVQADTDTINEQDRKSGSSYIGSVLIRQVLSSRIVAYYKANRIEGKKRKKANEREAVKVEA